MKKWFVLLIGLLCASPALSQSVQQSGLVTPGHATCWATTGVVYDCGSAGGSSIFGPYTANDLLAANNSGQIIDSGINPITGGSWSGLQNFNGGATGPTRPLGDNTTNVATTAFVLNAIATAIQHPINVLLPPYNADNTGTNDAAPAITAALTAAAGAPAGAYCVYIPAGKYKLSFALPVTAVGSCISGDGKNATVLSVVGNSAVIHVTAAATWTKITDLLVQNNGTPGSGSIGIQVDSGAGGITLLNIQFLNNYVGLIGGGTGRNICQNCDWVQNITDGFFVTNGMSAPDMQWIVLNGNSFRNGGLGLHVSSTLAGVVTGPYINGFTSVSDTGGCISYGGASGVEYGDVQILQVTCSGPGSDGITIAPGPRTTAHNVQAFVESAGQFPTGIGLATPASNVGAGIKLTGTGAADTEISFIGITLRGNSDQGLVAPSGPTVARMFLTEVHSFGNGLAGNNTVGIDLQNTSTIYTITASDSWNPTGETAGQTYGLRAARGGNVYLSQSNFNGNSIGGCNFTDSVLPTGSALGSGCQGNAPTFVNVSAQSFSATGTGATAFAGAPEVFWANTSAGLNAKGWYGYVGTTGTWHLCASDDAFSTCTDAISITRSGTTPTVSIPSLVAASVAVGSTVVSGGTTNQFLYDNGGVLGEVTKGNNCVYLTNGTGVPSCSLVLLADLATQSTNTVVGNATSVTASPTALSVGSCSTSASALNWTTNTGFGCNISITAAAAPLSGITGLGTGVATALGTNVGSAGAPVVNGDVLGTPSSGTVTNLTGTASININGTVGATTPTTGAFTTLKSTSSANGSNVFGTSGTTLSATVPISFHIGANENLYLFGPVHLGSGIFLGAAADNAGHVGMEFGNANQYYFDVSNGPVSIGTTSTTGTAINTSGTILMANLGTVTAGTNGAVCSTASSSTANGQIGNNVANCIASLAALKNIRPDPITGAEAINLISQLVPIWYDYKADEKHQEQPGFTAEQVFSVDPRLAIFGDTGLKGVRYEQMSALFVAAITKLKADNDNLRANFEAFMTGTHP